MIIIIINIFIQDDHFSYRNCYQHGSCVKLSLAVSDLGLGLGYSSSGYSKTIGHFRIISRLMRGIFSNANDINFLLMIFPRRSLHCMIVPVHYREYENGHSI